MIFPSQLKVLVRSNWSLTCRNSRRHQIYQVCAQRWFSQTCHHRHLGSQVMLRFLSIQCQTWLDLILTHPRFWSVCPHCCWRAILRWEKTWRSTQPVRSVEVMTIFLRKPNLGVASQCELEDIVGLERGGGLGCWSRPTTASTLHFKLLFSPSELTTKDQDFTFHFRGRSSIGAYNLAWSGSMKSSSRAITVGR